MTREEKIKGLYSLKEYLVENPIELDGYKSLPVTLIDYAIEALEQENCVGCTLEKLRADVTELLKEPAMYIPNYDAYRRVIKIIDKYREEI